MLLTAVCFVHHMFQVSIEKCLFVTSTPSFCHIIEFLLMLEVSVSHRLYWGPCGNMHLQLVDNTAEVEHN